MNLNHVNLCTNRVAEISAIFQDHFAFEVLDANEYSATLRGQDGFLLVLTQTAADSPKSYPYTHFPQFNFRFNFHVGFMLDSPGEVRAKHQQLKEAGLEPGSLNEYQALGASWTAFYCPVGDGIDIEVNAHVPLEKA